MPKHRLNDSMEPIEPDIARLVRLADEIARLAPVEERAIAEEGLGDDLASWPDY